MPDVNALFVYGTLARGGTRHALVAHHREAHDARMRGRLYDLHSGYPAAVDSGDAADAIHGDLLVFDALAPSLEMLDEYEGDQYRRVLRNVTAAGRIYEAYVYLARDERELLDRGATRIPSGRWNRSLDFSGRPDR